MYVGLAAENMAQLTEAEFLLMAAATGAFFYYQFIYGDYYDPNQYEMHDNAWMWAVTAVELSQTDAVWCTLIGGYVGKWPNGQCESDGIVSFESQHWPGNVAQFELTYGGPAHTQATKDESVITVVRQFIQTMPR
jgi:hypothetical protein